MLDTPSSRSRPRSSPCLAATPCQLSRGDVAARQRRRGPSGPNLLCSRCRPRSDPPTASFVEEYRFRSPPRRAARTRPCSWRPAIGDVEPEGRGPDRRPRTPQTVGDRVQRRAVGELLLHPGPVVELRIADDVPRRRDHDASSCCRRPDLVRCQAELLGHRRHSAASAAAGVVIPPARHVIRYPQLHDRSWVQEQFANSASLYSIADGLGCSRRSSTATRRWRTAPAPRTGRGAADSG